MGYAHNWDIFFMKNETKDIEVIQVKHEEFISTQQGRTIRSAMELHNDVPTPSINIIYPEKYILKKWLEYEKLITKKMLAYSKNRSEQDGFTRIYHYDKEIYKIETELYKTIQNIEIKDKLRKVFLTKRSRLKDISIIKLFGQGKTCKEIIEENEGLKSVKALQNRLPGIRDKITSNFDGFKNQYTLGAEKVIPKFYNEYRKLIDEMG